MDEARYTASPTRLEILWCPEKKEKKADFQLASDVSQRSFSFEFISCRHRCVNTLSLCPQWSVLFSFHMIRRECWKTLSAEGSLARRMDFVTVLIEGKIAQPYVDTKEDTQEGVIMDIAIFRKTSDKKTCLNNYLRAQTWNTKPVCRSPSFIAHTTTCLWISWEHPVFFSPAVTPCLVLQCFDLVGEL